MYETTMERVSEECSRRLTGDAIRVLGAIQLLREAFRKSGVVAYLFRGSAGPSWMSSNPIRHPLTYIRCDFLGDFDTRLLQHLG